MTGTIFSSWRMPAVGDRHSFSESDFSFTEQASVERICPPPCPIWRKAAQKMRAAMYPFCKSRRHFASDPRTSYDTFRPTGVKAFIRVTIEPAKVFLETLAALLQVLEPAGTSAPLPIERLR